MNTISTTTAGLLALGVAATAPLQARDEATGYYVTEAEGGEFADVVAELHDAVINRGLVIDFEGHVGDMLTRTADAVGMASPYADAEYFQFCSAPLTHAAVAASPDNLAICPYVVFAYTLESAPGEIRVGYRRPVGATDEASVEALGAIDALLHEIVGEVSDAP